MQFTNQLKKYVRSLHLRKHRQKYNKFIAEGPKICKEFLEGDRYRPEYLFGTADWLTQNAYLARKLPQNRVIQVTQKELDMISTLKTANEVVLLLEQATPPLNPSNWALYLDKIQDPGNLGAIMRIADWYGITTFYSSPDCVSYYNPKVVQAAMGAHNRLNLEQNSYEQLNYQYQYALCLNGESLETYIESPPGLIIVGNESKGISEPILAQVTHKVTIPKIGGAESLNAAVACGIACHRLIIA